MSDKTKIEWTDATWNPVTGCTKVSTGCDHCYAETIATRFFGTPLYPNGFEVTLRPERLDQPIRWKRPRRIFVNSMSDLFHADVPDDYIAQVFAVMAIASRHTFQVLTKRHGRMKALLNSRDFYATVRGHLRNTYGFSEVDAFGTDLFPLLNAWLGVSVEDQRTADLRIPALLDTPAAVRWLSCEPLLGHTWLTGLLPSDSEVLSPLGSHRRPTIDWVVVGGESGPNARPMHPSWALSLRDQCVAASVPFLFKQWGEWKPTERLGAGVLDDPREAYAEVVDDGKLQFIEWRRIMCRVGKKAAGRELDGRTWDEYPVRYE